jgi:hypothetical protein
MGAGTSKATLANKELYGPFSLAKSQNFKLSILSDLITMIVKNNNLFDLSELLTNPQGCKTLIILLENKMNQEFTTLRFPDPEQKSKMSLASFLPMKQYLTYQDMSVRKALCQDFAFFVVRFTTLASALITSVALQRNIATEIVNNRTNPTLFSSTSSRSLPPTLPVQRPPNSDEVVNIIRILDQEFHTIHQIPGENQRIYFFNDSRDVLWNATRGVVYLSPLGISTSIMKDGDRTNSTPVLGITITLRTQTDIPGYPRFLQRPGDFGAVGLGQKDYAGNPLGMRVDPWGIGNPRPQNVGIGPIYVPRNPQLYAAGPQVKGEAEALAQVPVTTSSVASVASSSLLTPSAYGYGRSRSISTAPSALSSGAPTQGSKSTGSTSTSSDNTRSQTRNELKSTSTGSTSTGSTSTGSKSTGSTSTGSTSTGSTSTGSTATSSDNMRSQTRNELRSTSRAQVRRTQRKEKSQRRKGTRKQRAGASDHLFDVQLYSMVQGLPQIYARFVMDARGITWDDADVLLRWGGRGGIRFEDRVRSLLNRQPQQDWVQMVDTPNAVVPQVDIFDTFSKIDSSTYDEFRFIQDSILGTNEVNRSLTSPAVYRALLLATAITPDLSGVPSVDTMFCRDTWIGKMTSVVPYALLNALYYNEPNQQRNAVSMQELNDLAGRFMYNEIIAKRSASLPRDSPKTQGMSLSSLDFVPSSERAKIFCETNPGPMASTRVPDQRIILTNAYKQLRELYDLHLQAVIDFFRKMISLKDMGLGKPYMIQLNQQFVKNPSGAMNVLEGYISEGRKLIANHYVQVETIYKKAIIAIENTYMGIPRTQAVIPTPSIRNNGPVVEKTNDLLQSRLYGKA